MLQNLLWYFKTFIINWPTIHICQTAQTVNIFIFCPGFQTELIKILLPEHVFKNHRKCLQIGICKILERVLLCEITLIFSSIQFEMLLMTTLFTASNYLYHYVERSWLSFSVQLPNKLLTLIFWLSFDVFQYNHQCLHLKHQIMYENRKYLIRQGSLWENRFLYRFLLPFLHVRSM